MFGEDALNVLLSIAIIRIMAWLTPGANMLAVLSAAVSHGRGVGVLTGLGIAFGGFVWVCLSVFGISTVFALFPQAVFLLKLAGAAYLLWLGIKSLKSAFNGSSVTLTTSKTSKRGFSAFTTGFFVTITNPKAALFYSSILTAFVPADANNALLGAIVIMSGSIGVITYSITALFFSSKPVVLAFQRAMRPITTAMGMLFCGLAVKVTYDAFKTY